MRRDELWTVHRAGLCFHDRQMDLVEWVVAVGEQPSLAGRKESIVSDNE